MQTTAVSGPAELLAVFEDDEDIDYELDSEAASSLWAIWDMFVEAHPRVDRICYIHEWFSMKELDARRPLLFARTEYDSSDKGAVLLGDVHIINISVVENHADTYFDIDMMVEELDISADDDYINESGKIWIPRTLTQSFVRYA